MGGWAAGTDELLKAKTLFHVNVPRNEEEREAKYDRETENWNEQDCA